MKSSYLPLSSLRRGLSSSSSGALFPRYQGLTINSITVYQVDLPLHEKAYKWSGGKQVETFDATVVRIGTKEGVEGWGENTPLGPNYLPAYAQGSRAGIAMLAPHLLHLDPTRIHHVNSVMDQAMKGHPYVKSALDMACWDIVGKVAGLPVCELLGGRFNDFFPLYRAISQDTPENMAKNVADYINQGYR